MDVVDALDASFEHTASLFDGVTPDQWSAPTPCREWDVRALATHTIGVVDNMGRGVRGESLLADVADADLGDDPAARFRDVAGATLAAWRGADLDASFDIGAGRPIPGHVGAAINLLDTSTHAWDLARATGQPEELPADVAAAALDAARRVVPDAARGLRGFDPVVATEPGATDTEQLVAFLGRRP